MRIAEGVALVSGANRGIGRAFVDVLLARGARKIYAAARRPESVVVDDPRIVPVRLDVTDARDAAAVAAACPDVTLLVSNAGISIHRPVLAGDGEAVAREMMEVNCFGPMRLTRALAPAIVAQGGGAIVYVSSMASRVLASVAPAYSASKAALDMMASGVREELRDKNTTVHVVMPGFVDADMGQEFQMPKVKPEQIAGRALDAVEAGAPNVFPDIFAEFTRDAIASQGLALLDEPNAVVMSLVGRLLAHHGIRPA